MDETTDLIKEAFEPKTWNEIHVTDSWRIFKIISEFVEGFEKLSRIGPSVAIFGSARTHFNNKYYKLADEIAFQLVQKGYGVITGGGPGIMEAANKGAKRGNGKSAGINIDLPFEQKPNPYIDRDKIITFDYFFVRKVMFMKYAQGFIVLPGDSAPSTNFSRLLHSFRQRRSGVSRLYWLVSTTGRGFSSGSPM